jgi:thioredoxin-like negative regulator of GroEL
MPSRREKLEAMLADAPRDVFLRYALALELEKEGDHAGSLSRLAELQCDDPPYVPAFFMAAQQLVSQDRITEARTALRAGIDQARHQGDAHAAGEMSELLSQLGAHGE